MIKLINISKSFNGDNILNDLNLDLMPGKITALLGESGSGKSTLLNIILGIVPLDQGKVLSFDKDITDRAIEDREVGIVFQENNLFPNLNVFENISYGINNNSALYKKKKVAELLELVNMPDLENRTINSLSGGQKQRVAIARSLAINPKILLLDESFSSLDPALRANLREEIRSIVKKLNIICLLVTHDKFEASTFSDNIAILNNGKIEQKGSARELYLRPQTSYICDFFGHGNWKESDEGKICFYAHASLDNDSSVKGEIISRSFSNGSYIYQIQLSKSQILKTVYSYDFYEKGESVGVDLGEEFVCS